MFYSRYVPQTSANFGSLDAPTPPVGPDSPKRNALSRQASFESDLKLHEKFDYERLKLDFKLKDADNRFLQEELMNKDKMLAMLTEGLKEVGGLFIFLLLLFHSNFFQFVLWFFVFCRSNNLKRSGFQAIKGSLMS
jgi:hypothetical protein